MLNSRDNCLVMQANLVGRFDTPLHTHTIVVISCAVNIRKENFLCDCIQLSGSRHSSVDSIELVQLHVITTIV